MTMITSLLIANRGEIACRIIRTARAMSIRTVAVYSDADATALHVRSADEAVHIGPSPARESYLVSEKIIAAALATKAEAIHPGYGFLSENAEFAQSVIDAGLVWVGPLPKSIRAMGLKDAAKARMIEAGVPVTPGYLGADQSPERLQTEAANPLVSPRLEEQVHDPEALIGSWLLFSAALVPHQRSRKRVRHLINWSRENDL